jgi:hypothetical protein
LDKLFDVDGTFFPGCVLEQDDTGGEGITKRDAALRGIRDGKGVQFTAELDSIKISSGKTGSAAALLLRIDIAGGRSAGYGR